MQKVWAYLQAINLHLLLLEEGQGVFMYLEYGKNSFAIGTVTNSLYFANYGKMQNTICQSCIGKFSTVISYW